MYVAKQARQVDQPRCPTVRPRTSSQSEGSPYEREAIERERDGSVVVLCPFV